MNNVGEEYNRVTQDMYDGCATSVRTKLLYSTERSGVKVGRQQGVAISPLLCITIMDDYIKRSRPRTTPGKVICRMTW